MRTKQRTFGKRWLSALLIVLFVLQSAAQAGSGCVSWALRGRCCCAVAQTDVPRTMDEVPACCMQAARASDGSGPAFRPTRSCDCKLAPIPVAPANGPAAESDDARASTRTVDGSSASNGFARWIETAAPVEPPASAADPSPPDPIGAPPPATRASVLRRLVALGVIAFLSDLGSVRL